MRKKCKRIIAGICIMGLLWQMVPAGKVSANQGMQERQKQSVEEKQNTDETPTSTTEEKAAPDVSDKKEAELIGNTDFDLDDVPEELSDSVDLDADEVTELDDVDKLDLYSFTTINVDDTKTLHVFDTPVKYYDETENEVKFIDNSLERSDETDANGEEYAFENSENSTKVYLPEHSSDYVSIADGGDEELLFSPIGEKEVSVNKKTFRFLGEDEKVAEYTDVFGDGYSLQYIPQSDGVKENIYIEKNRGKYEFSFHVKAPGLKPDCKEGREITFLNKENGEAVYTLGKLFIRDSYVGEPDDAEHLSFENQYRIQEADHDCYIVTYILDETFLNSESTQYPVLVDPSISPIKDIYDAPVYSGKANHNFSGNAYAEIGKVSPNFGTGYGFFQTKSMGKYIYINPKNIRRASLRVYEGSGTTYASTIYAYDTKKKWKSSTITWNKKPEKRGKAVSFCSIDKSGYYNFEITSSAKNWLSYALKEGGFSQRYGIMLAPKSSNQGRKDICTVNHGTASKRPCITIQYKEDTSVADGVYYLQNYNSGKNLSVDGKNAVQNTTAITMKQQWAVKRYANGYYCLANRYHGARGYLRADKGLDPMDANIWTNGTGDPIRYKIVRNNDGTGTYRILSKISGDLDALSISGGSTADGADARFSSYTRDAKKKWILKKVPESQLKPDLVVKEVSDYVVTTLMEHPITALVWSPLNNALATDTLFQIFDSNGSLVYRSNVATAAIKEGSPRQVSVNWKPQKTGKYTLKITVDSGNTCAESDESNNTYSKTINVIKGYKLQVYNYYDEGFITRYKENGVDMLKDVTEAVHDFYRDMFGVLLEMPEPIPMESQMDRCKKDNQGGVNKTTINTLCKHGEDNHTEWGDLWRDFWEHNKNNTAANKVIVQWTGHTVYEGNKQNNRCYCLGDYRLIMMININKAENKNSFLNTNSYIFTHELAHTLNATDHYCADSESKQCGNGNCVRCYRKYLQGMCQDCIMFNNYETEFDKICEQFWPTLVCPDCKMRITNYLEKWCLPEN